MADTGLLYGLGEGLQKGVDTYFKARGLLNQEAVEKNQMAMQQKYADLAEKSSDLAKRKSDFEMFQSGYTDSGAAGNQGGLSSGVTLPKGSQMPTTLEEDMKPGPAKQPPQQSVAPSPIVPQEKIPMEKLSAQQGGYDNTKSPISPADAGQISAQQEEPKGLLDPQAAKDVSPLSKKIVADMHQNSQFVPTPAKQKMMDIENLRLDHESQIYDKNSEVSKNAQEFAAEALKQYPQYATLIPKLKNFSAADLTSDNGLLGKIITGELGAKGQQIKGQGIATAMAGRVGVMQDNQTSHASDIIDKHPLIVRTTAQIAQLDVDQHTLNSSKIVTPQILHEISNGIASAMNGGRGAGLGMSQMQDLSTYGTQLAALEQRLLSKPEDGASPEIKKQASDTIDRLREAYQKYQGNLANKLAQGREYAHNPNATAAVKGAAAKYQAAPAQNNQITPDVADYAQKHGITPEAALAIKQKRAGGQ